MKPQTVSEVSYDVLLADLKKVMEQLAAHKYWSLRITGGEGQVRVEQTFSDAPYTVQVRGTIIDRR